MALHRCPACGRSGIALREVDRTYQVDGVSQRVEHVPMYVCPHCRERFVGPEGADYVDGKLATLRRRARRRRAA